MTNRFLTPKLSATTVCALSAITLAGGVLVSPAPALADEASQAPSATAEQNVSAEEKALEQTLSDQEPIGEGKTEISHGHVDMGPKFLDNQWTLMYHDDHEATPVWRQLHDVVLKADDTAKMSVPDDERYSFVQASPGEEVYVVPQTEMQGVVWPGWNTQDPEVVSKLGDGVTLTLEKVEGPGGFSMYLENGNFSAPQVLWTSDQQEPQDLFVEPNTHTHANWVFTTPGAYYVTVTAHTKLADGTEVSDTQTMQFAIGSETTADEVFANAPAESSSGETETGQAKTDQADQDDDTASQGISPLVWGGLVAVVLLAGAAVFIALTRKNTKNQQQAKDLLK